MNKKQKIFVAISLGLYLVPEIIWGTNLGLISFSPVENSSVVLTIILIQSLGLALSIYLFSKIKKSFLVYLLVLGLAILLIWSIYLIYLILATANMGA